MSRILSSTQSRRYREDMEELAAYRALGMTPGKLQDLIFPPDADAPLPLDLRGPDPALAAQEGYDLDRWDK